MLTPKKYLELSYSRIIIPDKESGTFTAKILEFPGCISQGDTLEEAYQNLERAAKAWIEAALDLDQEIPEPAQVLFHKKMLTPKIVIYCAEEVKRQGAGPLAVSW